MREEEGGRVSDEDVEMLTNVAARLQNEVEISAQQIIELKQECAQLEYEREMARSHRFIAWIVAPVVGIALGLTVGWRLGSDGQFDAGYRVARSEESPCP